MGCICSKEKEEEKVVEYNKEKEISRPSVQLVAPAPCQADEFEKPRVSSVGKDGTIQFKAGSRTNSGSANGSVHLKASSRTNSGSANGSVHLKAGSRTYSGSTNGSVNFRAGSRTNSGSVTTRIDEGSIKGNDVQREESFQHKRYATMDLGESGIAKMDMIVSLPRSSEGEVIASGWPTWLASVAGEAIKGWVPRRAESFEKLEKIGQGTYSSVYRARDLETGKIVAMKKVRFVNMDPESVRFMAREIHVLRQLDHPNVMKLECLATSRMSGHLYLIFEYMDHDLAGLAATRGIKFTESQIKCYMKQLLLGLEHCHSRGILHRDIKGANLLLDNRGNLKIGDFGLATFYRPDQKHPLTSRVVTLWYRAPELLLGSTDYDVAIDMWSAGCILAELYAGKPIMPGRTEVEQMHKIFKLCGSPSEDYWRRTKLPHATSFKPQHPYKRCLAETFKNFHPQALALVDKLLSVEPEDRGTAASALRSEFFTTEPLPCDPSALPKYPPSKEFHAKLRNEEARRKAEGVKGLGPESVRRRSRGSKDLITPEFNTQDSKTTSHKYNPQDNGGTEFRVEPAKGAAQNVFSHSTSMVHPALEASWTQKPTSSRNNSQRAHIPQVVADLSGSSNRRGERQSVKESSMGYVPRKNRIHYSGPLVPPGGNLEDMLKEHEKQIQQAVRRANHDKVRTGRNDNGTSYYYDKNIW